ncbi:MAG: discoidin domain-containing protein [Tannerella sp.]|nr:discoidin domain-containing protein [Tannerella sp.]
MEQELTGILMFSDSYNNQEYPASHVFDNAPDTYATSCPPFRTWIGLDLGKKYIITKIAYCPDGECTKPSRAQNKL